MAALMAVWLAVKLGLWVPMRAVSTAEMWDVGLEQ
jgi:hypothetical protein